MTRCVLKLIEYDGPEEWIATQLRKDEVVHERAIRCGAGQTLRIARIGQREGEVLQTLWRLPSDQKAAVQDLTEKFLAALAELGRPA